MFKLSLLVVVALATRALGYSAGAPEGVCDDMTPKHPVAPQSTPIPYKVALGKNEIKTGEEVDLTISGAKPFKGFLIQVRQGDKAVGSFQIAGGDKFAKTINCHGATASGATHKNASDKNNLVLKWKAPSASGEYKVFVTVAEDGGIFWARKPAGSIKVN